MQADPWLTIITKLTIDDMIKFNQIICKRQAKTHVTFLTYSIIFAAIFLASVISIEFNLQTPKNLLLTMCIYSWLIFLGLMVSNRLFRFSIHENTYYPQGYTLTEKNITISPEGLIIENDVSFGKIKWSAVIEIIESVDAIYIMVDKTSAFILPHRDFPLNVAPSQLCTIMKAHLETAMVKN